MRDLLFCFLLQLLRRINTSRYFFFKPLVTLTHFIIQVDTGLHFCFETQPYLLVMSYRLPSLQIVVVPCLSGQVTNQAINRSEVLREPQASCPCLLFLKYSDSWMESGNRAACPSSPRRQFSLKYMWPLGSLHCFRSSEST